MEKAEIQQTFDLNGVPGGIRTHGLKIRNLALYPAELRKQHDLSLLKLGYFKQFVHG
jgi:hypothetical protein